MNICEDIYELIMSKLNDILQYRDEKYLKYDGSYVTKGDLLCQNIIIDYVNSIKEDFTLISEELQSNQPDYNLKNGNFIIIDPIDGTENFVSHLKEWGVSICVYKGGKHYQSILVLPELNLKLMTGDKIIRKSSRIYGLSSSLTKSDLKKITGNHEYRIIGCCVYNMYNVIHGHYSVYENFKGAYIWDIIAGLNLALENKLSVYVNEEKYEGEMLLPNKRYCFKIQ